MLDKTWIAAKSIAAGLINGVIGLTNLTATILIKYAFEGDIFYYLELMPYKIQWTNLQQFILLVYIYKDIVLNLSTVCILNNG